MEKLPTELLTRIFAHLRASSGLSPLTRCALTARSWHQIAVVLLYEHVAVQRRNITLFSQNLSKTNAQLMRSLSVHLTMPDFARDRMKLFFNMNLPYDTNAKQDEACSTSLFYPLSKLIPTMVRLQSFSLIWASEYCSWTVRPLEVITAVLQNLPKTCVSLELDLAECTTRERMHVCPLVGDLFPHLRHLHLRLQSICPCIFGSLISASSQTGPLVSATLVCQEAKLCTRQDQSESLRLQSEGHYPAKAMIDVSLRLVRNLSLPSLEKLDVIDNGTGGNDVLGFPSILKLDCVRQETTVMPLSLVHYMDSLYIFRCPELHEIISKRSVLDTIAAGQPWQETDSPKGCRLPRALISSSDFLHPRALVFWPSRQAFYEVSENYIICLWRIERVCSQQLLHYEMRPGLDNFTNASLQIPTGWRVLPDPHQEDCPTMLVDDDSIFEPDIAETCCYFSKVDVDP